MGTNFYIKGTREKRWDDDSPEFHLGKRSAAGLFCWNCNVTLCKGRVHYSANDWHKTCPKCGLAPETETLETSSAGRELGFNKSEPVRKTGVKSCSSFSWAMTQENFEKLRHQEGKVIEDEYGTEYTFAEFEEVLRECPLRFFESVGRVFC